MKGRNLFWGLVFLVVGGLLLLNNLGIVDVNIWGLIWPTFLITVGVWTLLVATTSRQSLEVEEVSILLENFTSAVIDCDYGAGKLIIDSGAPSTTLLSGEFAGGVEYSVKDEGDQAYVRLKPSSLQFTQFFMPWMWTGRNWEIDLNDRVPLSLDIDSGASDLFLDLSDLQVTNLDIDTGASSVEVILPEKAGLTSVDIDGGAASLVVRIPEDVAARIKITSGLTSTSIDNERFPRVGGFYQSNDYDTAENKADIRINMGAASIEIKTL